MLALAGRVEALDRLQVPAALEADCAGRWWLTFYMQREVARMAANLGAECEHRIRDEPVRST